MLRYFLRRLHIFRHRAQTFHAVNNNLNPVNAKYLTGDIDDTINKYANENPYVFGHSETLNDLLGYWVFIITTGYVTSEGNKYYAQIAIGQNGKNVSRYFQTSTSWTSWQ